MTDTVRLTLTDRVATITLDDPERMNPLSRPAYRAIVDALTEAEEADVRCVVIEGAGDAFSSGYDIDAMGHEEDYSETPDQHVQTIQENEHELVRRVVEFPLPVVAKVDGPAIGDAAALAIACDVPLASERARIGFSHVRFALGMDCGVSYLLPRLVGRATAMELALTGRVLDGREAHELGLVARVFADDEFEARADEVVERLATGPPVAMRHIKRLVDQGHHSTLDEALVDEATTQAVVAGSDDYETAVQALRAGREPVFEGE